MRKIICLFTAAVVLFGTATASVVLAPSASAHTGHTLSIADAAVGEGTDGSLTVTLNPAPLVGETVSVDYATSNASPSTATRGEAAGGLTFPEDYLHEVDTLEFTALQASQPITLDITQDNVDEPNETFLVNIFDARTTCSTPCSSSGVSITRGRATYTINDDDAPAAFRINDVTQNEGNTGTTPPTGYNFTVTRTGGTAEDSTVNFATADDTATVADSDYTAASGTLTFPASDAATTSQTVTVDATGDTKDEATERFFLNLSGATNAGISDNQGVGTLTDDDEISASLTINDVTVPEPDDGTTPATFTVTKSGATGHAVTVNYATANGTASAPGDYASTSGPLSFAPNETSKTVTVDVQGDTVDESNETFFVNLSGATNATITDPQGQGTITEDDDNPRAAIDDVTVDEGGVASFTITLGDAPGRTESATVDFATDVATATASDFSPKTGSVVFGPGETEQVVTVNTTEDAIDEPDEVFFVRLSKPATCCTGGYDYSIDDADGEGTISDDDDATASLSVDSIDVTEGDSATSSATFTVTKAGTTEQHVSVKAMTADDTATSPADYGSMTETLRFAPSETTKTFTVPVRGDTIDEVSETFFVNLSLPSHATITDGQGVGTITDNDGPSADLTIDDVTVTEGNTGTTNATFTVSKTGTTERTVSVTASTANGSATAPADYESTTTTLTFLPSEASKTVTVPVKGDTVDEDNETFVVNLTNPSNATTSDAQGVGTITDNDTGTGTFAISDGKAAERATAVCSLTVMLSAPSVRTITVDYATSDEGSAEANDFVAEAGTLTFAPGERTKQIDIAIVADRRSESDEKFRVNLSNVSPSDAAMISDQTGICTIRDND